MTETQVSTRTITVDGITNSSVQPDPGTDRQSCRTDSLPPTFDPTTQTAPNSVGNSQTSLIRARDALIWGGYQTHNPGATVPHPAEDNILAGLTKKHTQTSTFSYVEGYDSQYPRQATWSTDEHPRGGTVAPTTSTENKVPNDQQSNEDSSPAYESEQLPHSNSMRSTQPELVTSARHDIVNRIREDGVSLDPETSMNTISSKFQRLSLTERILFTVSSFIIITTAITTITLLRTHGKGRKTFTRTLFMFGILIIMGSSGLSMFAVRRNFGEVVFTMCLVMIMGIFLGSYLDILGSYGPVG